MREFEQDVLGRCDFLDVLEEAVLRRRPVTLRLRSGEQLCDAVLDVVTEAGSEHVVLRGRGRVPVAELAALGPAPDAAG